jgi:hypothetical protein
LSRTFVLEFYNNTIILLRIKVPKKSKPPLSFFFFFFFFCSHTKRICSQLFFAPPEIAPMIRFDLIYYFSLFSFSFPFLFLFIYLFFVYLFCFILFYFSFCFAIKEKYTQDYSCFITTTKLKITKGTQIYVPKENNKGVFLYFTDLLSLLCYHIKKYYYQISVSSFIYLFCFALPSLTLLNMCDTKKVLTNQFIDF